MKTNEKFIYMDMYGCIRRKMEMTKIQKYLQMNKYHFVDNPKRANHIIVGTCAFKEKEEQNSIERLHYYAKFTKNVVAYGCFPDINPTEYKKINNISKIAPKDIDKIDTFFTNVHVPYIEVAEPYMIDHSMSVSMRRMIRNRKINKIFHISNVNAGFKHLMYMIKKNESPYHLFVSRGCLGKCSYCMIKRAIGKVKSKKLSIIENEFEYGLEAGYKKFVVLGDDPGAYGLDNNSSFPDLMNLIKSKYYKYKNKQHISIKIDDIHPKHLLLYKNEIIKIIKDPIFSSILCPIQSGSDKILKLMKREHSAQDILDMLSRIKQKKHDLELSTHVIVGFPSESDSDFRKTIKMIKKIKFNSVVIFPYHEKKNSEAASIEQKVHYRKIISRMKEASTELKKSGVKVYTSCP